MTGRGEVSDDTRASFCAERNLASTRLGSLAVELLFIEDEIVGWAGATDGNLRKGCDFAVLGHFCFGG